MADTSYNIEITGNAIKVLKNIQKNTQGLNKNVEKVGKTSKRSFGLFKNGINSLKIQAVTQNLRNMAETFENVIQPGLKFEQNMSELSALTGATGTKLEQIGKFARQNAKVFGGDAAKSVKIYQALLSQLGPSLADTPEILSMMGNSVASMAKTMGGDTNGAVEVLTTAMNQYGISLDDPIKAQNELNKMMNTMAASAQAGSAEIPALQQALQQTGGMAKSANVSFEATVSAIQALDKAGKKGATGGVNLRNVLTTLGQGRFLPPDVKKNLTELGIDYNKLADKSISFNDKLKMMKPLLNDTALLSKMFGRETVLGAQALITNADSQKEMTTAITGTTSAQDQANIVMQSTAERMKRVHAFLDDLKISFFNATGAAAPFIEVGMKGLAGMASMAPALEATVNMVGKLRKSEKALLIVRKASRILHLKQIKTMVKSLAIGAKDLVIKGAQATWTAVVTAAQWLWNIAMTANPIGLIIAAIGLLIVAVVAVVKHFGGFKKVFNNIKVWFFKFFGPIINAFKKMWDGIKLIFSGHIIEGLKMLGSGILEYLLAPFKIVWKYLKKAFGWLFGDKDKKEIKISEEKEVTEKLKGDKKKTDKKDNKEKDTEDTSMESMTFGNNKGNGNTSTSSGSGETVNKRNLTVRIAQLVGTLNINTTTLKESEGEIRRQINKALIGAVRDFETAI